MKPLFYSDYLEGCCPEILERLARTNYEQTPGYGEDVYCDRARELILRACGLEGTDAEVHFLVGGTQTNSTVLAALLRPHQGVVCAGSGHIAVHETGAVEHTGHKVLPLPATEGRISAAQVDEALRSHFEDANHEHMVQPGAVYISFPTEVGTLYGKDELTAMSKVCRKWGIPFFVDGARLGYGLASAQCDVTLKDIASLADVFYIGGTKQGALFGEAVVFTAGNGRLARDFRYMMKQGGGMLAKGRLLGIQFEVLFEDGLYLRLAGRADRLAAQIQQAFVDAGYRMYAVSPTNQVFPVLTKERMEAFDRKFGFEVWAQLGNGLTAVRFCTSWATRDEVVSELVEEIKKR